MSKKLIIEEVAELTRVSKRYVMEQVKLGELKCSKMGKRLIFDPLEVEKWIKRKQAS